MGLFDGHKIDRLIERGSIDEVGMLGTEFYDRGDYGNYARLWIGYAQRLDRTHSQSGSNPDAWCIAGRIYEKGIGVYPDMRLAFYWYNKASNCGMMSNEDAMYKLGYFYENGYGTFCDMEEAVKWYRRASGSGSEEARRALERLGY